MSNILDDAVEFYCSCLETSAQGVEFLKSRGITGKTAKAFRLGATGQFTDSFVSAMTTKYGYSVDALQDFGLVRSNGVVADTFFGSVIIPVFDSKGRVANITGRRYDNYDTHCKYMNLAGIRITDLFGIQTTVNYDKYRQFKYLGRYVFACEGQFDTMMLQQNAIFALGIFGVSNLRKNIIDTLATFESVVLAFDNDMPGRKCTNEVASFIKGANKKTKVYFIDFPQGVKDINDFLLNNDIEDLIECILPVEEIEPKEFKGAKKKQLRLTKFDEEIENLRKIDIVALVDTIHPTKAKRATTETVKMRCILPDHDDSVGSFTLYKKNNSFYCFGCGRGGTVITLCMEYFGISFKEAVEFLKKGAHK